MSMESFLTNIRLSVIGDDEIKQLLIDSSQFTEMYQVLDEIINQLVIDQVQLDILDKILIIINSLTYYAPKLLNDNNTANRLVLVAIKYQNDDRILHNTFKCLMNLTSKSARNTAISLDNEIGHDFTSLLSSKLYHFNTIPKYNNSLYLQLFKLLPHLNPLDIKSLLPSLLNILKTILQKPQLLLLAKYKNSDIYVNCYENQSIPTMLPIANFSVLLTPLLYSISHLISHEKFTQSVSVFGSESKSYSKESLRIDELIGRDLYFTLTSLLRTNNQDLKLASITVLVNFSLYSSLSKFNKICNVKKILPVLIQLTDSFDKLEETLSSFKSEYKHSKNFNPFFILSKLCLEFEFVHEFLINCNIIKKISDFLKNINKNKQIEEVSIDKLDNLIDFFLILSSISSENERNRKLIINDDLVQVIEKILRNHHRILYNEIVRDKNTQAFEWLSVSNHLALSSVYLLRSLSRSVPILRTTLYESSLIESLLDLIKIGDPETESTLESLTDDTSTTTTFINDEVLLKSVILSILSNFVLDFSPLRPLLLIDNDLISIIANILLNTRHSILIRNSLWCSRHILFNEQPDKKDEFLRKIGIDKIFEFILNNESDEAIQKEAFDVIRNLTCDSRKHVLLTLSYKATRDFDFFQLISTVISNSLGKETVNNALLETVAFVIVNMAGVDEETRDLIASKRELLCKVKEIMQSDKVDLDAKLACVWILINLTWTKNSTTYVNEEDVPISEEVFYDDDRLALDDHSSQIMEDDPSSSDPREREASTNVAAAGRRNQTETRNLTQRVRRRIEILDNLQIPAVLISLIEDNNNVDLRERVKGCLLNLSRFS